ATVCHTMRKPTYNKVTTRNLEEIQKLIANKAITTVYDATVSDITATTVKLKTRAGETTIANDVVFSMIGGDSPKGWLDGIGVKHTRKPHSWSPPRTD